jgi:hypothetical protein
MKSAAMRAGAIRQTAPSSRHAEQAGRAPAARAAARIGRAERLSDQGRAAVPKPVPGIR